MKLLIGPYEVIRELIHEKQEDVFEFVFPYVGMTERFREIDRFLYESKHSRRYVSEYVGKVIIDITEWSDTEYCNSYFTAFMMFLKDHQRQYDCVLTSEKDCCSKLLSHLQTLFDIEKISLGKVRTDERPRIGFRSDTIDKENEGNVRS